MNSELVLEILFQDMENGRCCSLHIFSNLIIPLVGDLYGPKAMLDVRKLTKENRKPYGYYNIVEYTLKDNITAGDVMFMLETQNMLQIRVDHGELFEGTPQQFADAFFSNVNLQSLEAWAKMNQYHMVVSYDDGSVDKVFDYQPTREE